MLTVHLKIIGIILILLSTIHIGFPKYFQWKKELQSLQLVNRQMMYVHTFFIALMVFLIGILCICCTHDMVYTKLGQQVSLGLSVFWGIRLLFQFFVYAPRLWKGKIFETIIHILFSLLWLYMGIIFLLVFIRAHSSLRYYI